MLRRAVVGISDKMLIMHLKELEAENQRLKRIVADQVLENQALKEIAKGNW